MYESALEINMQGDDRHQHTTKTCLFSKVQHFIPSYVTNHFYLNYTLDPLSVILLILQLKLHSINDHRLCICFVVLHLH